MNIREAVFALENHKTLSTAELSIAQVKAITPHKGEIDTDSGKVFDGFQSSRVKDGVYYGDLVLLSSLGLESLPRFSIGEVLAVGEPSKN